MLLDPENGTLVHYGTKRHSGRYPWGSGGNVVARSGDFLGFVEKLKAQGLSEKKIAEACGFKSVTELRNMNTIAVAERQAERQTQAIRLKNTGMSNVAIAKEMGVSEGTVRNLLSGQQKDRNALIKAAATTLKEIVDKKKYVDIGAGVEQYMGMTSTKFKVVVSLLEQQGYTKHYVMIDQLGTGHQTRMKILVPPGVTYGELIKNRDKIVPPVAFRSKDGVSFELPKRPTSVDSKRVAVVWKEDGGANSDGMIYLRRGVDDISLGKSNYAQVRIAVDGTHYIKGMAMYKDDMPKGKDIEFHTNKPKSSNIKDALKEFGKDPDNPFTSAIVRQHGVLNIVNEEGDWDNWARNLSSQFLSKQKPSLAKSQLDMTFETKKNELAAIMKMNNPVVRKKLLEEFSDGVDSASVHLKAAGLPRTAAHVILPLKSIKPTEIYAPNFNNGERVVLIRHPHGGTFEIPELVVNNKNPSARKAFGTTLKDAVGIHHSVAEKLSGADFDGDTVLVIPNNKGLVSHSPSLLGLKNFDPKETYKAYPGMPRIKEETMQIEMGKVSNLITDMTIKGAPASEIAAAVRHSMVVIDSYKHSLNYKQSEKDNNISHLKAKWQGKSTAGAATIISRAKSKVDIPERKQLVTVDPATGKQIFTPTNRYVVDRNGNRVLKSQKIKRLELATDARDLVSDNGGTKIEHVYADHSNRLKALANQARKEAYHTPPSPYSPSANKAYKKEVDELEAALNVALKNAPRERQAQVIANASYRAKLKANPSMSKEEKKKLKSIELKKARHKVGADKTLVDISSKQWEAIQAGALSNTRIRAILDNADPEVYKKHALPNERLLMTGTKKTRAETMLRSGYTQAEVAQALGVSVTTLQRSLKGE